MTLINLYAEKIKMFKGAFNKLSNKLINLNRKSRGKLSTILIVAGIVTMVVPFTTEVYGYFMSIQMTKEWDEQAQMQKKQAKKVQKTQDRLVSTGKLPKEETIIGSSSTETVEKEKQKVAQKKPFPKTKITIPKIGVNQVILEGTAPEVLKYGPGHYTGTANPGDKGNVGIAGHRVTYTHPFNRLDELTTGDRIILETVDFTYEYAVQNMVVVDPKNVSTLMPTEDPRITLTTCNPKYSAKTRLNVIGVLIDSKPRRTSIIRTVKAVFKEKKKVEKPKIEVKEVKKTYEELMKDLAKGKRAIKKNPLDAVAYAELSRTYLALEMFSDSIRALREAELIKPNSLEVQKARVLFDARIKDIKRKVSIDKALSANSSTDPALYIDLGFVHLLDGKYQEAAEIFKKSASILPYTTDLYVYEATAYEKMGKNDVAIESYKKALVYDPYCPEALNGIKRLEDKKPAGVLDISKLPYGLRPQ